MLTAAAMDGFDADAEHILAAVDAGVKSDADSDAELDTLCQIVKSSHKTTAFKQRGAELLRVARMAKTLKHLKRAPKVAPHVAQRIEKHNRSFAKTLEDHIDLQEKRPVKIKGRGAYKRWLPSALLRACWGPRNTKRVCQRPKLSDAKHRRAPDALPSSVGPTSASTRSYASPTT